MIIKTRRRGGGGDSQSIVIKGFKVIDKQVNKDNKIYKSEAHLYGQFAIIHFLFERKRLFPNVIICKLFVLKVNCKLHLKCLKA